MIASDATAAVVSDEAGRLVDELAEGPIAVTGGTGFVGSHVVEALCRAGRRPRVLVRNRTNPRWIGSAPVEWVEGSLDDGSTLESLVDGARTVLHLAGVVRAAGAAEFNRANRDGTERLVAAVNRCAAERCRLVAVSSLAAAGPSGSVAGVTPDDVPHPVSQYGRSKLAGERALVGLGADKTAVVVRPPAIYGPRDTDIFEFFRLADRGVVPIPAGERWITIAWVGDVVRWIVAAATGRVDGKILHVGEPEPYLLSALVHLLAAAGGRRARVVPVPAAVMRIAGVAGGALHRLGARRIALTPDKVRELTARQWTADTRSSLRALGVEDAVPFEHGAALTWEWYRQQGWLSYHDAAGDGESTLDGR